MERYDDRIACYDRVVITGTLPRFAMRSKICIFDHPTFAQTLRDRLRDGAAALAATGTRSSTLRRAISERRRLFVGF